MSSEAFLTLARKWYGDEESAEGMHSRTLFYVVRDGKQFFLKEAHEVFDEAGNKRLSIRVQSLACGHTVEDPKELVAVGQYFYCVRCVHPCPSCGTPIVPGAGEQVEQVWYHKACASSPKQHFELKRSLEEGFLVAKLDSAGLQNRLTQAQIDTAYASIHIQSERLRLEEMREEFQRAHIAAQTRAVYANVRLQDERLWFEREQARDRLALEREGLEQRATALGSQIASERVQRRINEGRFTLEWMERVKKLEDEGYLPKGSGQKALP